MCENCKKTVDDDENFCPFCGKQLKENPIIAYYNQSSIAVITSKIDKESIINLLAERTVFLTRQPEYATAEEIERLILCARTLKIFV